MTWRALLGMLALVGAPAALAADAQDYSVAERALFMTNHLQAIKPPTDLHYTFRKSGSLEAAFDDTAVVHLTAQAGKGGCCAASGEFLHDQRKVPTPTLDAAEGNPVIQYFLDRDINEMKRLTGGSSNYFRKMIRMALYQGAKVRDTTFRYRGKDVAGQEIAISPYVDDPNRARYAKLSNKLYLFMLSGEVPGGVYGIRTRIAGETESAPPQIVEEMMIVGAGAAARSP